MYIYMNLYLADAIIFLKYLLLIDIFYIKGCTNYQNGKKAYNQSVESFIKYNIFSPFIKNYKDENILIIPIILGGEKQITNLPYVQNNESENKSLKNSLIKIILCLTNFSCYLTFFQKYFPYKKNKFCLWRKRKFCMR